MGNTLLLDTVRWDLVVDQNGDIAMATEPYSLAQDAASQCRLFQGELWYDTTQGIPYFQDVLGQMPPLPLLKALFVQAAELVPGVISAQAFISAITETRVIVGQVQTVSQTGQLAAAEFFQGQIITSSY